jgi:hypothetical protein
MAMRRTPAARAAPISINAVEISGPLRVGT